MPSPIMVALDNVLDCIPHLVWQTDSEGKMVYVNSSWMEYTGLKGADSAALSSLWSDLVHPDDATGARDSWSQCMQQKKTASVECRIKRTSGEYCWHKVLFTLFNS